MDKIKILFIHHGVGIGGAPINLINVINELKGSNIYCKVALVKGGSSEILFSKNDIDYDVINASSNYFLHCITDKHRFFPFIKYSKIIYFWYKTVLIDAPNYLNKNKNFNIIHLGSHGLTSWAYAAKKMNFKVVLHNQETVKKGLFGFRKSILKNLIIKYTDAVLNISFYNKKMLGVKKSKIIYNFISIPNQYRESMASPNQKRKVLFMGGMAKIKGFQTAIDCLPYLDSNITLQFAGNLSQWKSSDTLKEKFKNLIKLSLYRSTYYPLLKMYRSKNAEVLGLLKEPLPVIDDSDILITPFKIEHFSRPAVEAFAYGKPVIGSDVEGMDEIIDHGVNGLLVEKNNPIALAEAINYLCQNPDIARQMGLKGREKAEQVFSPEINTKKVEVIYQQLMA